MAVKRFSLPFLVLLSLTPLSPFYSRSPSRNQRDDARLNFGWTPSIRLHLFPLACILPLSPSSRPDSNPSLLPLISLLNPLCS